MDEKTCFTPNQTTKINEITDRIFLLFQENDFFRISIVDENFEKKKIINGLKKPELIVDYSQIILITKVGHETEQNKESIRDTNFKNIKEKLNQIVDQAITENIKIEIIDRFDQEHINGNDKEIVLIIALKNGTNNEFLSFLSNKKNLLKVFAIGLIPLGLLTLFAWSYGWINGGRVTSKQMVNRIESTLPHPLPSGYRRAHAKGTCFTAIFRGSKEVRAISKASVFYQEQIPVIGRFSTSSGDPSTPDNAGKVVSMAMQLTSDDNQQWRMAMNNKPFFDVSTPEGFYDRIEAYRPNPKTKKIDSAKIAAFYEKHPEAKKFANWVKDTPWPDSYTSSEFYSANAFKFINHEGLVTFARWFLRPHVAPRNLSEIDRKNAPFDFLHKDLIEKLKHNKVYFDVVLIIANHNDPVNDPSQPWPANRKQIVAGVIEIVSASEQASGACRDINYDPTILPFGIQISDDPVLKARSGAYSHSYNSRVREVTQSDKKYGKK